MLNQSQKDKLKFFMEKDVKILRQVIYKEIMEWRRKMYEPEESKLNVEGELRKLMTLTDADKEFIDTQVQWFLLGEIPDSILIPYAKQTLESLKKNSNPTYAQKNLKQDLESALTIGAPPVSEDVPF